MRPARLPLVALMSAVVLTGVGCSTQADAEAVTFQLRVDYAGAARSIGEAVGKAVEAAVTAKIVGEAQEVTERAAPSSEDPSPP
jgi:hypothetical protein